MRKNKKFCEIIHLQLHANVFMCSHVLGNRGATVRKRGWEQSGTLRVFRRIVRRFSGSMALGVVVAVTSASHIAIAEVIVIKDENLFGAENPKASCFCDENYAKAMFPLRKVQGSCIAATELADLRGFRLM